MSLSGQLSAAAAAAHKRITADHDCSLRAGAKCLLAQLCGSKECRPNLRTLSQVARRPSKGSDTTSNLCLCKSSPKIRRRNFCPVRRGRQQVHSIGRLCSNCFEKTPERSKIPSSLSGSQLFASSTLTSWPLFVVGGGLKRGALSACAHMEIMRRVRAYRRPIERFTARRSTFCGLRAHKHRPRCRQKLAHKI